MVRACQGKITGSIWYSERKRAHTERIKQRKTNSSKQYCLYFDNMIRFDPYVNYTNNLISDIE